MLPATGLHAGMAIRLEGSVYKVLEAQAHAGQGKLSGFVHARLVKLGTDSPTERRFRLEEKVETLDLSKRMLEYSYSTGDEFYFMDPESYDQIAVPREIVGDRSVFLKEGSRLFVEFLGDEPVSAMLPDFVELRVVSTAPAMHASDSSTQKRATLENGMEILVPLFIKEGEVVRVAVEGRKYVERVREAKR